MALERKGNLSSGGSEPCQGLNEPEWLCRSGPALRLCGRRSSSVPGAQVLCLTALLSLPPDLRFDHVTIHRAAAQHGREGVAEA